MATLSPAAAPQGAPIGFAEFVALAAALMAMGALGIDSMLPALPAIGRSLAVTDPNHRQFVVSAFLGGFGVAQLAHGPLADRYGRRTLLAWSLAGYAVANVAAAATSRPRDRDPGTGRLVLTNGKIHTFDDGGSVVSSVAIQDGKFDQVGRSVEARGGRVVNLRGRTVVNLWNDWTHLYSLRRARPIVSIQNKRIGAQVFEAGA